MSVLIKGMEMPKSCEECNLESFCDKWIEARKMCGEWKLGVKATIRHPDCPLVPAADVRPVVRGKFIFDENDYLHCSECDCSFAALMYTVGSKLFVRPNYCPNCGAEMESES